MNRQILYRFFVVAIDGSLWRIDGEGPGQGASLTQMCGPPSETALIETRLPCGSKISITQGGIVPYPAPDRSPEAESAFPATMQDTAAVVALFLNEQRALECLKASDQVVSDTRWAQDTSTVLKAIGSGHPVFDLPLNEAHRLPIATATPSSATIAA